MTDTPLASLGRYRIVSELGRGAMGVVYRAEDPQLERSVAIKTIRMSSDSGELAEYIARFQQEAKALGGLNHPAIITVFDIGRENDIAYMAMEMLEGMVLRDLLSESRLPIRLIVDLAAQVADGLAFAHDRGIVHRDIKPANIMVVNGDRAKIMDFGIARVRVSDIKTQTGMLLGSPKYMSPEQVLGRPLDHRSDIFSLGVVLYEMLAGMAPFSGADISQLMYQVVNARPTPPSRINPESPELLDFIVAKALEKDPEDRYQDAVELADDLRLCRDALTDQQLAGRAARPGGDTLPLDAESPPPAADANSAGAPAIPLDAATESFPRAIPATVPTATARGSSTLAGASLGLRLSLRSDSTRALARLTRPSMLDRQLLSPTGQAGGKAGRLRQDSDMLGVIALLGVAAAIALALVFI